MSFSPGNRLSRALFMTPKNHFHISAMKIIHKLIQIPLIVAAVIPSIILLIVCIVIAFVTFLQRGSRRGACHPVHCALGQEVLVVQICEVVLCTAVSAKGLSVRDFLQVVQAAGDAAIAV